MAKSLLFIFNRFSGKGKTAKNLAGIVDVFCKNGYMPTVVTTMHPDHMQEIILAYADKYDLIAVSGGDGTLQEAVTGLMRIPKDKRPLLGYIPAGSTNDFARSIGIPANMIKAAEMITCFNGKLCDVGRFGDEYFSYVAAFGAFTEVTYQTPQEFKNLIGHPAYYIEGVKSLQNIRSVRLSVEADSDVIEGNFIYGMISNSKSVGGVKNWAGKDVLLDDGIFELTLVKEVESPFVLNEVLPELFTGNSSAHVIRRKCSSARFYSDENIDWVLDGEFGGSMNEVSFKVLKQELRICV